MCVDLLISAFIQLFNGRTQRSGASHGQAGHDMAKLVVYIHGFAAFFLFYLSFAVAAIFRNKALY
jgi:hypothetical protein